MKKLLYFIIGFSLPFIAYDVKAAGFFDVSCIDNRFSDYSIIALVDDSQAAYDIVSGFDTFKAYKGTASRNVYLNTACAVAVPEYTKSQLTKIVWADGDTSNPRQCVMIKPAGYTHIATSLDLPQDTDGDGVPDNIDFYPDDGTPQLVQRNGACYGADGQETGVRYKTTDGREVMIGHCDGSKMLDEFGYPWEVPPGEGNEYGELTDADFPKIGDDIQKMPSGQSDGTPTEKDELADRGQDINENDDDATIAKKNAINARATAKNTARLNDYAKDLNKAVQGMAKNDAKKWQRTQDRDAQEKIDKKKTEDELTAQKKSWADYDPVADLEGEVNGELVEGEGGDYKAPGKISEETWVIEMVKTNPIKTIFNDSGFRFYNSSAKMTLNLGHLGTHELDISKLEAGFIAFGNLLFSLVTIAGIVHVATGRVY